MPVLDEDIFEQVMSECEDVDRACLQNVLWRFNREYALKAEKNEEIDYKELREDSLEYNDLINLFDYVPYKDAVDMYYLLRIKKLREERKEAEEHVGKATDVSTQEATIRVTTDVSITFKARKPTGKLKFPYDIDTGFERTVFIGSSKYVPDEPYKKARLQAMVIMNKERGFAKRTSN